MPFCAVWPPGTDRKKGFEIVLGSRRISAPWPR